MTKSLSFTAGALVVSIAALFAGQTRTWTQGEFADFQKGVIQHLSVRSDGLLELAPSSV